MATADRLLFGLLILVLGLLLLRRSEPQQALPLVRADYCLPVIEPPLGPHPTNKVPHPRMPDNA